MCFWFHTRAAGVKLERKAAAAAAVSAYGCGAAGVQVVVTRHLRAASSAKTT
jgi:hypothetical protein